MEPKIKNKPAAKGFVVPGVQIDEAENGPPEPDKEVYQS